MDRRALLGLPRDLAGGRGGGGPATYVRLSTVTANARRAGGGSGVMTVETGVDVPDAALRTRATQSAPRLRAAYNGVVQRAASALLPGAPPDVDRLARELQSETDRILGRAGARVLLGTVMIV
ncbi:Tat pathway signal protein [Brevundimonas fluminis]|uniref:Tat pathway signal protein n=1 Tax=Brevundimonas fluminis TaxID=2487274 RepID=UPI000F658735|nr:Tat pathway signal protein [Brevundimonas fluminis]